MIHAAIRTALGSFANCIMAFYDASDVQTRIVHNAIINFVEPEYRSAAL
jgi:hypothetical protein